MDGCWRVTFRFGQGALATYAPQCPMAETIRAVRRTLDLLQTMRARSFWTLQELTHANGLPKATLHRILATLAEEGYVAASHPSFYRLTAKSLQIDTPLGQRALCADLAERIVMDATDRLEWPVSFAVAETPFMRIVACGMSRNPPRSARPTSAGRRHWMFSSAVGNAYVSASSEPEMKQIIRMANEHNTKSDKALPIPSSQALSAMRMQTRQAGYAVRFAQKADPNSAVAMPVYVNGVVAGAFACSIFPHSLSQDTLSLIAKVLAEAAETLSAKVEALRVEIAAGGPTFRL
jgi:IclR family mhp operon transcriptional activator